MSLRRPFFSNHDSHLPESCLLCTFKFHLNNLMRANVFNFKNTAAVILLGKNIEKYLHSLNAVLRHTINEEISKKICHLSMKVLRVLHICVSALSGVKTCPEHKEPRGSKLCSPISKSWDSWLV